MVNENLIPLQSLISCFLEPLANRRVAMGSPGFSKGSTICCALVAVVQEDGGLFCP